jgi:hypothetical protein
VVAVVEEDCRSVPIEFFLREKRASLKDQDVFACVGEVECESSTAGSGTDDDGVVVVGHEFLRVRIWFGIGP